MKRDYTTRRTIGKREVIITIKGHGMGKRGPKRKESVLRTPSGQISRSRSQAQTLTEIAAAERRKIQAVVLAQPHRQGDDHEWMASALGRFCRKHRLRKEFFDGAQKYATTHQQWLVAMGKPAGYENVALGGTTKGPSDDQVKRWKSLVDQVNLMLMRSFDPAVVAIVLRLAVDDRDMLDSQQRHSIMVISALGEIGVLILGLERNPHPFSR